MDVVPGAVCPCPFKRRHRCGRSRKERQRLRQEFDRRLDALPRELKDLIGEFWVSEHHKKMRKRFYGIEVDVRVHRLAGLFQSKPDTARLRFWAKARKPFPDLFLGHVFDDSYRAWFVGGSKHFILFDEIGSVLFDEIEGSVYSSHSDARLNLIDALRAAIRDGRLFRDSRRAWPNPPLNFFVPHLPSTSPNRLSSRAVRATGSVAVEAPEPEGYGWIARI